ncbi:hypothetical protein GWI33_009244 [Rhynchophorus ferrugineus]|uniref:Uncharacterized protein n=1 Tax=Rhynchophorus ferrugineus TaxID=354439 RepID=A0A834MBQ7_RHYFE|nr:hypothetical protein GWI33_009244 [Rhynchophorus ferrugineus]
MDDISREQFKNGNSVVVAHTEKETGKVLNFIRKLLRDRGGTRQSGHVSLRSGLFVYDTGVGLIVDATGKRTTRSQWMIPPIYERFV